MLLMGLPTVKEAQEFKKTLDLFNLALGTIINQEKSQVFFFNTPLGNPMTPDHPARISTFLPPIQIFRIPPPPQISP
jgi:hypothetical protein